MFVPVAERVKMGENGYWAQIGYKWVKMDIGYARNQKHHNHVGNTQAYRRD